MLHLYSRCFSMAFFGFLILASSVKAESISEWPVQKEIKTAAFEKRFIEIFKSEPESLQGLYPGLVKCKIDDEKAGKVSNINTEALEAPYKNIPDMKIEFDLDIDRLNIMSTVEGCAELKTVKLERLSNSAIKYYQVPSLFKSPLMIDAKYQYQQVTTMQINGDDHVTESENDVVQQTFYLYPESPGHLDFTQEIYIIFDMGFGEKSVHSTSATFVNTNKSSSKVSRVALSRSDMAGTLSNSLTINSKDDLGQEKISIYGKDSLMTIINGKSHGLRISKNYLYDSDKTAEPLSHACYDMGEKINIFKAISDTDCIAATEDQIGKQNVYMDEIYKMQRDMDKKLAAIPEYEAPKPVVSAIKKERKVEQAKKKKQESNFNQLVSKAKCDLANSNWVYTGSKCKDGAAHGKGSAEDRTGLKFIGSFEAGNRVKGEIHQDGEMIYSGELVDDKPSGGAICLFEGEYEECRFFRGKRIDTLYKIRKENAKNQEKMAKMQKENRVAAATTKDSSNYVVDALEKEGAKRAASFIFDKLF